MDCSIRSDHMRKKNLYWKTVLNKTIHDYWPGGSEWTAANVTPVLTNFAFKQAEEQMEISLRKLKIDDMVREQVDTFPVAVLGGSRAWYFKARVQDDYRTRGIAWRFDWNRSRPYRLGNKFILGGTIHDSEYL